MRLLTSAIAVRPHECRRASRLGLRGEMWNAAFISRVGLDCEDLDLTLEWARSSQSLGCHRTRSAQRTTTTRARESSSCAGFRAGREHLDQSRSLKTAFQHSWRTVPSRTGCAVAVRTGQPIIPGRMLRRLYHLHVATRDSGVWFLKRPPWLRVSTITSPRGARRLRVLRGSAIAVRPILR
jgi:hypothetical protein